MNHLLRKLIQTIPPLHSSKLIHKQIFIQNMKRLRFPKSCSFINNLHSSEIVARRSIYPSPQEPRLPKMPDLVYMPHLIRYSMSKLKLKYLKIRWDPEFSEGAFIYGVTQAVCRVTKIIRQESVADLKHLMTVSASIKLENDMQYRITKQQKEIVEIKPDDIKIIVPLSVELKQSEHQKLCRIKLRTLALKWHELGFGSYKLVLIALQIEFLRDYSANAVPEWTISGFDVLECVQLAETVA